MEESIQVGKNGGAYVSCRIGGITWGYLIDVGSALLAREGFSERMS